MTQRPAIDRRLFCNILQIHPETFGQEEHPRLNAVVIQSMPDARSPQTFGTHPIFTQHGEGCGHEIKRHDLIGFETISLAKLSASINIPEYPTIPAHA